MSYQSSVTMMPEAPRAVVNDKDDMVARIVAAVQQTAGWQFLEGLMTDPLMMEAFLARQQPPDPLEDSMVVDQGMGMEEDGTIPAEEAPDEGEAIEERSPMMEQSSRRGTKVRRGKNRQQPHKAEVAAIHFGQDEDPREFSHVSPDMEAGGDFPEEEWNRGRQRKPKPVGEPSRNKRRTQADTVIPDVDEIDVLRDGDGDADRVEAHLEDETPFIPQQPKTADDRDAWGNTQPVRRAARRKPSGGGMSRREMLGMIGKGIAGVAGAGAAGTAALINSFGNQNAKNQAVEAVKETVEPGTIGKVQRPKAPPKQEQPERRSRQPGWSGTDGVDEPYRTEAGDDAMNGEEDMEGAGHAMYERDDGDYDDDRDEEDEDGELLHSEGDHRDEEEIDEQEDEEEDFIPEELEGAEEDEPHQMERGGRPVRRAMKEADWGDEHTELTEDDGFQEDEIEAQQAQADRYVDSEDMEAVEMEPHQFTGGKGKMERGGQPVRRRAAKVRRAAMGGGMGAGGTLGGNTGYLPSEVGPEDPDQLEHPSKAMADKKFTDLTRLGRQHSRTRVRNMRVSTQPQEMPPEEEVEAMRTQLVDRLDALERENHTLRVKNSRIENQLTLVIKNQRQRSFRERLQRRHNDLLQLENEGIMLDVHEEMGTPEENGDAFVLPQAAWDRKINAIRTRYQRAPVTERFDYQSHQVPGAPVQKQGGFQSRQEMLTAAASLLDENGAVSDPHAAKRAWAAKVNGSAS